QAHHRRDRAPRLPGHPGERTLRRHRGDRRQPDRRPSLRAARSAHTLHVMAPPPDTDTAAVALPAIGEARTRKAPSAWQLLLGDRVAVSAAAFLILVALAAIAADLLVRAGILLDPLLQDLLSRNKPPMYSDDAGLHLLGTDQLGRDLFSRLIYG